MILSALNNYYERLVEQGADDVPAYGFSQEKISYALVLDKNGALVEIKNLMDTSGKKPRPQTMLVPQPPKRSVNIDPCFMWDKTAYVLGLTASTAAKDVERAGKAFEAFRDYHQQWLGDVDDDDIRAVLMFLDSWNPQDAQCTEQIPEEVLDSNVVFQVDHKNRFLHQLPLINDVRARQLNAGGESVTCLVTGEKAAPVVLHPTIKGVNGAQSSGASLVSFNLDAFTSYGKKQGHNAPVSERTAFGYGTALNYLLRRDEANKHRLQIGDSTVVFWAEAEPAQAEAAENLLSGLLNPATPTDEQENKTLYSTLAKVAAGRPLTELNPNLQDSTRIYVLGLAPNASRLSIRFWQVDSLAVFAKRLAQHYQDLLLTPLPWKSEPAVWRLLAETVSHREGSKPKLDDVSPQLAGEMARAILTGSRYPRSLLSNLIMRMRADGDVSSLRVALCKAVLVRDARLSNRSHDDKEIPVSLDINNTDPGYLLGRLFAALESVQRAALGGNVNASIRDRYFGAASATPSSIFPVLMRNAQNHLSKIKKEKPGLAINLEKQLDEIIDKLGPQLPRSLRMESQGRFAIGYYHQRSEIFKKHDAEIKEGEAQ
ncbi:type I-C CRISPR-associated protein Cas8c/Csd1 [Spongiibacter tropicus]|uniref:type I-C CRISPR-associated protein Cas8c/Csd1 n=1 Tax=Spongiibacter tropicus TaxID=454602 RepID=UPI002351FC94|nr:type I-C CRISPR-associated protein Cas8c/Csd1 [Spongiibacter tropicus]|tara:strand:+ start:11324 stop:13120 length:1797 start_codon:yes stop_codon:yes gene_type:complete